MFALKVELKPVVLNFVKYFCVYVLVGAIEEKQHSNKSSSVLTKMSVVKYIVSAYVVFLFTHVI